MDKQKCTTSLEENLRCRIKFLEKLLYQMVEYFDNHGCICKDSECYREIKIALKR